MRKLFGLILSGLVLAFSCIPASAEVTTEFNSAQEEAYSVLKNLGFINEYYDEETVLGHGLVTRAEFAEFISGVFNYENVKSENVYFHDVPRNHYAFSQISLMVERGAISINSDKLFYPEQPITSTEAAKIIIYSLGYSTLCEQAGGWPMGVNNVATGFNIYNDITVADKISYADMLVMVYNGITVELPKLMVGNVEYIEEGETYLSNRYDVYAGEGILRGFDGAGVFGEEVGENDVIIDEMYFDDFTADISHLLGKEVSYYYKKTKDGDSLMWIEDSGKSDELVLYYNNDRVSFDEKNLEFTYYNESGKKKTEKISQNVSVVYNGEYLDNDVLKILSEDLYKVSLIASDGQDFDVVIAESYEDYIFENADLTRGILFVRACDSGLVEEKYEQIKLRDYKNVEIILKDGTSGKIEDLKSGMILSVSPSENNEKLRVFVSDNVVSGKVISQDYDSEYQRFILDDTAYFVYKKNLNLNILAGDTVEFKMDAFGCIAKVNIKNTTTKLGYLTKGIFNEDVDEFIIRMFTQDGQMQNFTVSDRVKLNNENYKTSKDVYNLMGAKYIEPQLIAFSLNADGKINMIDTAEDISQNPQPVQNDMLIRQNEFATYAYTAFNQGMLGPKIRVNSDSVLMSISSDVNDSSKDNIFTVGQYSDLINQQTYNVESYQYGMKQNETADIVLVKDKYLSPDNFLSTRVLVDKVIKTVEDEEVVYKISGYHGNTYKELLCTPNLSENMPEVVKGDLIGVGSYVNGKVNGLSVTYGPNSKTRPLNKNYSISGSRISVVFVHDVIGNSVFCGYDSGENWDEIYVPGNSKVFIYDSELNEVREGNTQEIISYKSAGAECDKLFVYIVNGEVRNFVIFR